MRDAQVRFEQMIEKLKQQEFRLTPQRLAIVRFLAQSREHPSADHIFREVRKDFPTTSLATIYKTVSLLKEVGEVIELGFSDDSNRYDGNNPQPHPHLICTRCKAIVDPDIASLQEISKELSNVTGYQIISHRVDFFGICPRCQKDIKN